MAKDQAATLSPMKDIRWTVCGLVKVVMKEAGSEFEGNLIFDGQFAGS